MGKCYYMIDSIKGGCGKTTFSIMLAQFLQKVNEDSDKNDRVCLLDFDFLGTGLAPLFFAQSLEKQFSNDYEYLTKIIRGFNIDDKKYLYDGKIGETPFLVGFSDPDYRRKEAYYISSKLNYTPAIHYGVFRDGIRRILKNNFEDQIDTSVESIVLDMSPGMDAYSQIVKDCLFNKRYSAFVNEDDKRYYFLMAGTDNSQLHAAANYFQEFVNSEDERPDRIFIVLNDWVGLAIGERGGGEKDRGKEVYDAWLLEFENNLDIPERDEVDIIFLIPHYFEKYWTTTHQRIALVDTKKNEDVFEAIPFRYWKKWGEKELKVVEAEECKEIISSSEKVKTQGELLKCLKG